jgi:hypothetical protein
MKRTSQHYDGALGGTEVEDVVELTLSLHHGRADVADELKSPAFDGRCRRVCDTSWATGSPRKIAGRVAELGITTSASRAGFTRP